METNEKSNENMAVSEGLAVNTGIKAGGIFLVIGIALIGFNLLMIKSTGRFFVKLTGLGFIAFYAGLGMLLAPGKKVFNSNTKGKEAVNDLVGETKGFSVVIWILYVIGGIAACIYTILCKYWQDILALFAATIAITAAFFVLKHIIFFFTNPAEKMQEQEDGKYAEGNGQSGSADSRSENSESAALLREVEAAIGYTRFNEGVAAEKRSDREAEQRRLDFEREREAERKRQDSRDRIEQEKRRTRSRGQSR